MTKAEFDIIVKNVVTHGNTLKYMAIYVNKYYYIAIYICEYMKIQKRNAFILFLIMIYFNTPT